MGDDEVQVAIALQQTAGEENGFDYDPFIQSDEYFPLTRRQMKQSWRYLRRPVRQGPRVELDIEATINQIGHLGIFLEPVLVPLRINQAQLFFLIDQGGSMVPFHALSHRLADTALRGGRLGAANVYYFHNWPEDSFYHDPSYLEAEPLQDMLAKLSHEQTVVMIFSDAAASSGSYNERRIEQTERFLEHLRQHALYYLVESYVSRALGGDHCK